MFIRQTWALVEKNLRIVLYRHWLGTLIRAFLAPIIFMFIIAYAKNFFGKPLSEQAAHFRVREPLLMGVGNEKCPLVTLASETLCLCGLSAAR